MTFSFDVVPAATNHIEGFNAAVDTVARESRFLAALEGPLLESTRKFISEGVNKNWPQFVAVSNSRVIGWCDVIPLQRPLHAHVGVLGMGVLAEFRGRGVGKALMLAAIEKAKTIGITRIELIVREENERAIGLYRKIGFVVEGIKQCSTRIDGHYCNDLLMALLLNDTQK
jgi:ribosomal protein S18 acetylase RimI-like enzyme